MSLLVHKQVLALLVHAFYTKTFKGSWVKQAYLPIYFPLYTLNSPRGR